MDNISVTELPKPGGMMRDWPQPYEITIQPELHDKRPELDFLHKGDSITLSDGVTYIVERATQQYVLSEHGGAYKTYNDGHWNWVYRAVKDRSNEEEAQPW